MRNEKRKKGPAKYTIEIEETEIPIFLSPDGIEYLTTTAAGLYLGISPYTANRIILEWESEGKIHRMEFPGYVGRGKCIPRTEVDQILEELRKGKPVKINEKVNQGEM